MESEQVQQAERACLELCTSGKDCAEQGRPQIRCWLKNWDEMCFGGEIHCQKLGRAQDTVCRAPRPLQSS